MDAAGLEVFDKTLQESDRWLRIVMEELETDNRRLAFAALRATLHALRDRIGPAHVADLGALLPMLLRGAYYEGWQPTKTRARERHLGAFLDQIAAELRRNADLGPLEAARASFVALSECMDASAVEKLIEATEFDMRLLWPGLIHPVQSLQAH
jgi:uncharacterized protein (DUF2267 family)